MQPLTENSMEVPSKLKLELLCDPAIPLQDIYPEKTKTLILKDAHAHKFIAALFTIAQPRKRASSGAQQ